MIIAAGSNDPVTVSINRLSGWSLNRCGQKPYRFFCGASCLPFGCDIYAEEGLNFRPNASARVSCLDRPLVDAVGVSLRQRWPMWISYRSLRANTANGNFPD